DTKGLVLSHTYPASTEQSLLLMSSFTSGWKNKRCNSPVYQVFTYERNTPTPSMMYSSYSFSQSTDSPLSCLEINRAAVAPDSDAKQTPDENTGSKNSALFPVSA